MDVVEMMIKSQKEYEKKMKEKGFPESLYKYEDKVRFKFGDDTKVGCVYIVDKYGTFEQHEEPSYDILVKEENLLYKHIRQRYIVGKEEE